MNKTLLAIGLAAAMSSTYSYAATYPDFTVQEGFVTGVPNVFTADKITGNYVETAVFTPTSALAGTFTLSLVWDAGQFVGLDGTVPQPNVGDQYLGAPNAFGGYSMFANLNGSGTYSTVLGAIVSGYQTSTTTFTFAAGGSLALFLDDDKNKLTVGDQIQIAQGAFLGGSGTLDTTKAECDNPNTPENEGNNCGSFAANTSFTLINGGENYFTSPSPFYNLAFGSGQLNNFEVSGTQTINGSMDVTFEGTTVPEPASVALLGIGLMGLGAIRRKQA